MTDTQEKVFRNGEGDAWYRRNRKHLSEYRNDWATWLISSLEGRESITRVCELGCANGWRLARLRPLFSTRCVISGIDVSEEAIADGKKSFPEIELRQGVLSNLPYKESFDLVIVNFVLHWIDRDMLTRAIAEIDRVVKWNGYLVLGDFLPDFPTKRHYHHRPGEPIFTYKQDYAEIFRGLGFYKEITRITFSHDRADARKDDWIRPTDSDSRGVVSLLHKLPDSYMER